MCSVCKTYVNNYLHEGSTLPRAASVFLTRPMLSHLTQVHDLHLYGSTVDSALRDSTWEIQTYVHFQDHDGVTVVIKPEHRVEDVLTLACKVMGFAVVIYTAQ